MRIVFAGAVSIGDLQSLIAYINHNPDEFSSGFFVLKKMRSLLFDFLKTKKTMGTSLMRIVFAGVVSIGEIYNPIAHFKKLRLPFTPYLASN
jgi:hypothetical protein